MTDVRLSRRALLQGAASAAALTSAAAGTAIGLTGARSSTQPSRSAWRALAAGLDGRLVRPGQAGFEAAHELFNPRWDSVRPAGVVEAASAHDVSEAIGFARRHGLPIRPRSGGHSYVGDSVVQDGLVVSAEPLGQVRYDAGTRAATVGAGSRLYAVHTALAGHGRTLPTGSCPTVGAAGLTLGGGVGVESRAYGLTCDRLVGAQIVTADGRILDVNHRRHPGLLWACRGGGGDNVGIVTSLTYDTVPTRSLGLFLATFPWSHAAAVLRGWAARVGRMRRSSWANVHVEGSADGSTDIRIVGVCDAGHEAAELSAMEAAVGVPPTSASHFTDRYLEGLRFLGGGTTSPRQGWTAGSDVVARMPRLVARAIPRLVAARASSGHAVAVILDPLTGAVTDVAPSATAFPWRRHLATIQWYLPLPDHPTHAQVRSATTWIGRAHAAVSGASAGGYVNYVEPQRSVASYYGGNIGALRTLKAQWDPTGLFHSRYGVR